jgi:SAM-dependent methyltransferase
MTTLSTIGNNSNFKKLLHELNQKFTLSSKIPKSEGVLADINAHVKIGRVFGGYFNSERNAKSFTKVGLSHYVSSLPQESIFADLGGGDGYLASEIKRFIHSYGKDTQGIIVDGNPSALEKAKNRGFATLEANLEDEIPGKYDLITMRAALHYNSVDAQKKILYNTKKSLNSRGFFINQISSGDPYNVSLRNTISSLHSLQRVKSPGTVHYSTINEYLKMCKDINLPTIFLGYAPEDYWTPEEMFDRFHPDVKCMTKQELKNYTKRNNFLQETREIISLYKEKTPIEGINFENGTYTIWRKYPIFLSRLPERI